jgi:hypothetical protein
VLGVGDWEWARPLHVGRRDLLADVGQCGATNPGDWPPRGAWPTRGRLLAGVFSKAAVLIGSGTMAGNAVLLLVVVLSDEVDVSFIVGPLMMTSTVMAVVSMLACVEPARRALKIAPTEALKES